MNMKVSPFIYVLISILLVGITVVLTIVVKDMYFTNESMCDTQEPEDTQKEEIQEDTANKISTGTFKVEFTYPSEFIPGIRFCLTDVTDESNIACFYQKGTYDTNTYTKEYLLEKGLNIPVGQYYLDFAEYDLKEGHVYTTFRLNNCTKAANGWNEKSEADKACKNYYNSDYYPDQEYMVNLEEYGGPAEIINITADTTTDIGKISVMPYFSK